MNARSGVVLALGLLLSGLILLLWCGSQSEVGGPTSIHGTESVVAPASSTDGSDEPWRATAVGDSLRQPGDRQGGVRLRIVDAADRAPLPEATVRWRRGTMRWRSEPVDNDGEVRLVCDEADDVELSVSSQGYCALHGSLRLDFAAADVPLERGGDVAFCVVDAAGNPAAGVEVALLPPLVAGRWEADWHDLQAGGAPMIATDVAVRLSVVDGAVTRHGEELVSGSRVLLPRFLAHAPVRRATGADGVARWHGVAPGDGYRCGIVGRHHATLQPTHELRRLRVTAEGVVVGRPPPPNLSGAFPVAAMVEAAVSATLLGEAAVHGTVRCQPGALVSIKLCRIHQAGGGDVQPVTTVDAERIQEIGRGGSFRFENVRPGIFAVRACWLENDHDVYFVSSTLQLLPGMNLDLGELAPMRGAAVRVRAELHNRGQRVPPAQVFAAPLRAAVSMSISFLPDSQSLADAVTEVAVVPFGQDYLLHGVPAGRLQLQATPLQGMATRSHVQRLESAAVLDERVEQLGEVVPVVVEVHAGVLARIATVDERGDDVPVHVVHAVDLTSGHVQSLALDPESTEGHGLAARVVRGRHLLCASLSIGGQWLAGVAECEVQTAGDSVRMEMLPAATIRGRYVVEAGSTTGSTTLRWSPAAFAKQGIWLFSAMPNAAGEFVLNGIPSGVELVGDDGLPTLQRVASAQDHNVGIITRR